MEGWWQERQNFDKLEPLPARLTVGHVPLKDGIGVRFPGRQPTRAALEKRRCNTF